MYKLSTIYSCYQSGKKVKFKLQTQHSNWSMKPKELEEAIFS